MTLCASTNSDFVTHIPTIAPATARTVTTITSYDKNGNVLEMTVKDTAGAVRLTTSQQYDALNRLKQLTKTAAALPNIITKYGYWKARGSRLHCDRSQEQR